MNETIPKKMTAAVLYEDGKIRLESLNTPQPMEDEVLARVRAVAICGTDPKIIKGVYKGMWPKSYPAIIGHEWAGEIVQVGPSVKRARVGDRVAGEPHKGCGYCRMCMTGRYNLCENYGNLEAGHRHYGFTAPGAYAQYIACSERTVHLIPESISFEEATNVDTAGTALHGVKRGKVLPGEDVAVIGPGAVGLISFQIAKALGAGRVFVIGRKHRLQLAKEMGALPIDFEAGDPVKQVKDQTGGRGVDVAIDCAGTVETVQQAVAMTKRGGRAVINGFPPAPVELPVTQMVLDEKDLLGVRADPNTCEEVIPLMANGSIKIKPMISHVFPLEEFEKALKVFTERLEKAVKVIVKP
ncbi:MAG: alcohol dehydrogenase catalytic domain-containing protein [Thermodesulfobacteriota bacterium]